MLVRASRKKGIPASPEALEIIAQRSRFNARQATIYLSFIFDLMTVRDHRVLSTSLIMEAFEKLGVDHRGFSERDRTYLALLPEDRAVGLQYLAAVTGIDEKTLEQEIEPYLMRLGIIDRTSRGRTKLKVMDEVYHGTTYRPSV
jgi:Holliday junction DNA helicase RuvB